jgi:ribosomal protein S4
LSNDQKAKQVRYLPDFNQNIKFLNLQKLEFYSIFNLQKKNKENNSLYKNEVFKGLWSLPIGKTNKQEQSQSYRKNYFDTNKLTPPFLFSANQIKYELLKKQARSSDFKNQLKERKKLSIIYGKFSKKYIKNTLIQASKLNGKLNDNFLFLLEARLDVVLFRASFFSSIRSARQWISHNKILVNNNVINTASYKLKPGDIISITSENRTSLSKKILQKINLHNYSSLQKDKADKQKLSQNKPNNEFLISNSLLIKLKKFLKNSVNSKFIIDYLKKNSFNSNFNLSYFNFNKASAINHCLTHCPTGHGKDGSNFFLAEKNPVFRGKDNAVKANQLSLDKEKSKIKPLTIAYSGKVKQNQNLLNYKKFVFELKQIIRSLLNKNLQFKTQNLKFINIILNSFNSKKIKQNLSDNASALNRAKSTSIPTVSDRTMAKLINFERLIDKEVFSLGEVEKKFLLFNLIQLEFLEKKNLNTLEGLRYFLVFLKLKKFFFNNEFKNQNFSVLNINILKPLNLEISYKNLVIIYLYSPQKFTFPCNLDIELINQSFS